MRSLQALRSAGPVPPHSLTHVMHVLQQVASGEGRPVPVQEAQLLLSLAAAANALPASTMVHLPWAWGQVVLPDGYIPATAQEASLHAYLGEPAAAQLVHQVALAQGPPEPGPQPAPTHSHPSRVRNRRPPPRSLLRKHRQPTRLAIPAPKPGPPAAPALCLAPVAPLLLCHMLYHTNLVAMANRGPPHKPCPLTRLTRAHACWMRTCAAMRGPRFRDALIALDRYDASDVLSQPSALFRVPPTFIRGQMRQALQCALASIDACSDPSSLDAERAWKLWLFLPRMLLHRPGGASRIPKPALRARFQQFFQGDWPALLDEALAGTVPQQPTRQPNDDARADPAVHLAHLGELSAARQALLAKPLAAGEGAWLPEPWLSISPMFLIRPRDPISMHWLHALARRPSRTACS